MTTSSLPPRHDRTCRSKTNGEPRNRQVDTGNLERPAPELTDAYNAANEAISVTYGTPGAEAFGDPLAEPDGGEGGLDLAGAEWRRGIVKPVGCATDGDRLHPGLGALLESFIGRLAAQAAVGAVVVVEVLPFPQLVVEDLGVVDHHPVQQLVELLGVDAVRAFDLAVAPGRPRLDVVMADAPVQDVIVEQGLELRAVVGLDDLDPERQPFQHVVEELDGRLLVELG